VHELRRGDTAEFTRQALNPNVCFLCARELDETNRTREHVFPKWLLERCALWDAELSLLNRTSIRYRHLTIACCTQCNNERLAPLESEIAAAFAEGPEAVRNLDPDRLFVWLAKFYYGLLFRELTLLLTRSDLAQGPIVTEELLREYGIHHLLMRRLLGEVEWNEFPATIFVFEALRGEPPSINFDYFDAFDAPFLCLRIDRVFLSAFLQDFGTVRQLGVEDGPRLSAARKLKLHPFQCGELMALFYTVLKLQERPPKIVVGKTQSVWQVNVMPLGGLTQASPFADWNPELFRRVFEQLFLSKFRLPIKGSPGEPSFLFDSRGQPLQAPAADWAPSTWDSADVQSG
jgi:hypothetical protein